MTFVKEEKRWERQVCGDGDSWSHSFNKYFTSAYYAPNAVPGK